MLACRRMRKLLAASIYEDLDAAGRAALDRHLARCAPCRDRYAAFAALRDGIGMANPAEFTGDLLPALRQRLAGEPERLADGTRWRFALAGTVGALVVVLSSFGVFYADTHSSPAATSSPMAAAPDSPVAPYLGEAARLTAAHDYAAAYQVLHEAVTRFEDDPLAGQAQMALAELAFDELHWYPEADAAYDLLQRKYRSTLEKAPSMAEALRRWDLLAEARACNYSSLHELDAARRRGPDGLEHLEGVIARYPATFVAALAVSDMGDIVAGQDNVADRTIALERARDRCDDAAAVAQLNIEIANSYAAGNNLDRARELYTNASQCENPALASLARASLDRLGQ